MVHIIPLSVGQRRRDAGNAAQYPDAPPVSEAPGQLGDEWQAIAERYQQRMAQQQAFDTEIAARRLNGEIARAEADAVANAPADGAGLHHAMYGEVDPHTGRVFLKGQFDTLFDNFLKQTPPELRPDLASRKEALRAAGSMRMAIQQLQRRKQYEQDQLAAVQAEELDNIAKSDPDDAATFDASRQAGLDLIAKMDLDPQIRLQSEAAWRASTAKARMEALIAQDPRRAAEMLSAGPRASDQGAQPKQRIDNVTTDSVALTDSLNASDEKHQRTRPQIDELFQGDILPEDRRLLLRQARTADAQRRIQARVNVSFADQHRPDAISDTATRHGPISNHLITLSGAREGDPADQKGDSGASNSSSIFNRLVPTYGNYGGPGWTGGAWGGDFKPPAVDIQDGFYKQHDAGYRDATNLDDKIAADRQLVASLNEYLQNGTYWEDPALQTNTERIQAAIYAEGALRAFRTKIAASIVARADAQKAYDDAQSAVGRSHFENTVTFGNW